VIPANARAAVLGAVFGLAALLLCAVAGVSPWTVIGAFGVTVVLPVLIGIAPPGKPPGTEPRDAYGDPNDN
jgi:hypothetical protein